MRNRGIAVRANCLYPGHVCRIRQCHPLFIPAGLRQILHGAGRIGCRQHLRGHGQFPGNDLLRRHRTGNYYRFRGAGFIVKNHQPLSDVRHLAAVFAAD